MSVSVNEVKHKLRVPQARILQALMPANLDDPPCDWPYLTRSVMGQRAGYSPISGSTNRALMGIPVTGSRKTGEPHLGLLALDYVVCEELDIDGVSEQNYHITAEGIKAFQDYVSEHGNHLPPVKDAAMCVNDRYKKEEDE